jgi:hypothetical protein
MTTKPPPPLKHISPNTSSLILIFPYWAYPKISEFQDIA